ncbi:MAG: hypothetical protein H0T65_15270 [Deltaproteobacteria bacterium]|nr:hypothetical protein [Deltaproteobacteria bacterium]
MTELRAACLANRRRALGVLVDALLAIDERGAKFARRAVYALPALDDCNAAEHLAARQPEPRDPQQRAELAKLAIWFDSARTKASLGNPRDAIPLLVDIADRAERLGYHPLVAEALRVAGREQLPLKETASVATLRRALHAAQAGADDVLIAEISIDLGASASIANRPEAERDELIAAARAAVARLRWRQDSTLVGMESFLGWAVGQDALARGALDVAEREMRAAVAAGVTAFGAHDRRLPALRNGLAQVLKRLGKQDEAAVVWAQSLDTEHLTSSSSSVARVPDLGGVPLSLVEAAWELRDVGRDAEAQAFVDRVRREMAGTTLPAFLSGTLDDLESSIALERGDLVKARTLNERALATLGATAISAHAAGFHQTRGEILEASGDCVGARAAYRDVLAVTSHHTIEQAVRLGLARCLAKGGDLGEAAAMFDREIADGIDIARTVPTTLLAAADVHWRLGAHDKAHELAREGLRAIAKTPVLVREQAALAVWILSHPT